MPSVPAADLPDARSPAAYFSRLSERTFLATSHTGGGWSPHEQHISPLNGLVVHAIERAVDDAAEPDDRKLISRMSFDILGTVAIDEVEVDVRTVRQGRTIELVEAVVRCRDRDVLRARAWRLESFDTESVSGGQPARLPRPQELPQWPMSEVWPGGYIASLDVRRSAPGQVGRAIAWVSSPLPLLADEAVSPLATYVGHVDTANGIANRLPPEQWMFANVDLTIHLHRQPITGVVGLDTSVVFGPAGQGLTSSVLHDERGAVGHAAQVLTVRPRQSSGG